MRKICAFEIFFVILSPKRTFMETLAYNQRDENEQLWFVVGSKNHMKELQIRDEARQQGLEAFVPVKYSYETKRGQKQRKLIAAITGYVFVKATVRELAAFFEKSHYILYPMKSTFSDREDFLIVPNHDMENFIAVIEKAEEHITYFKPDEISLQAGDKIRIKGGLYDGREGIIMRIKGKRNKHLVVQIPGVLIAAVELEPDLVHIPPTTLRERASKNIDKDKRLVYETARRMLFEIPDKYKQEEEFYLLMNELKRGVERIRTFKGYTAATETELALPMYMAAVILNDGIPEAETRLRNAIGRLKDSSKLKKEAEDMLQKLGSA